VEKEARSASIKRKKENTDEQKESQIREDESERRRWRPIVSGIGWDVEAEGGFILF